MNTLKVVAGVLALADSLLGIYLSFTSTFSTVNAALPIVLFWASVLLLVDSPICIYGVHYAFPVAGFLSVVLAAVAPLVMSGSPLRELLLMALSIVSLGADMLAFRSKSTLSEQANPMNLPVFG
jgi:hypothetical protein